MHHAMLSTKLLPHGMCLLSLPAGHVGLLRSLPTRTDSELSPALLPLSIACTLYSVRLGTWKLFASVYVVSVLSVSPT